MRKVNFEGYRMKKKTGALLFILSILINFSAFANPCDSVQRVITGNDAKLLAIGLYVNNNSQGVNNTQGVIPDVERTGAVFCKYVTYPDSASGHSGGSPYFQYVCNPNQGNTVNFYLYVGLSHIGALNTFAQQIDCEAATSGQQTLGQVIDNPSMLRSYSCSVTAVWKDTCTNPSF
jgi:hypothetical protein